MDKSRIAVIVVLILTLIVVVDANASRGLIFDTWMEGFEVERLPLQTGEGGHAAVDSEVEVPTAGIAKLIIRTYTGSVSVRGSESELVQGTYTFTVMADTQAQAADYLNRLSVSVEPGPEGVLIMDFVEPKFRQPYIRSVDTDLVLLLPRRMAVEVEGWSAVDLQDIDGDVTVNSVGETTLSRIGGSLNATVTGMRSGPVNIVVHSPLSITSVAGDVALRASGCKTEVAQVGGTLNAVISGGVCRIHGVGGAVDLTSTESNVFLDGPGGAFGGTVVHGSLEVENLREDMELSGRMSAIRIRPAAGAGFDIRGELHMAMWSTDYELEATGDGHSTDLRGAIGPGGSRLTVKLHGGYLEIRSANP